MSAQRLILPTLLTLILIAAASASQPSFTPQTGVVVLRNGQVLHGKITRAGDYYVVTLGPASEIRLKADDVEIACRTLDEAYVHRLQRLDPTSQDQRIALAEWCLRNNLLGQATVQLDLAAELNADNPQIESLRERISFARQPKPTAAPPKPIASIATVGSEQLEQALHGVPDGSVEKFSVVVQPILLNRCGANQCHGPMSKTDFQLLKPAPGQVANQRFSQRNLYSTLRFLDHDDPQGSPLLIMPQRRHGGSDEPIFDERTRDQLEELSAWVMMTVAKPEPATVPERIDPRSSLLSSGHHPQVAGRTPMPKAEQSAGGAEDKDSTAANSKVGPNAEGEKPPAGNAYVPRDPFDPEVFNRRFFSGK